MDEIKLTKRNKIIIGAGIIGSVTLAFVLGMNFDNACVARGLQKIFSTDKELEKKMFEHVMKEFGEDIFK